MQWGLRRPSAAAADCRPLPQDKASAGHRRRPQQLPQRPASDRCVRNAIAAYVVIHDSMCHVQQNDWPHYHLAYVPSNLPPSLSTLQTAASHCGLLVDLDNQHLCHIAQRIRGAGFCPLASSLAL